MNKKLTILVMLVTLLALGLMLGSCDNGTTSNSQTRKFEGTWKHPNPSSENATIKFTSDSFVYSWDNGSKNGSFTYDDTNIVFSVNDGTKWSTTYEFKSKTSIRFENGTGCFWWYGEFEKQ
ncbi:hypothetical protein LQZ21_01260 [Treponema sp. TIM-1]|uniref:hypothetical protein n=1 Tax=Treponema sp. TIM-1 TaxID=2898417 RepID=UPI00397F29E6